jgi:hypothetical protein
MEELNSKNLNICFHNPFLLFTSIQKKIQERFRKDSGDSGKIQEIQDLFSSPTQEFYFIGLKNKK